MNNLSTASNQLKHQIKTLLLSPPPHPKNKHTYKSFQGPKQQSEGHCHCCTDSGRSCTLGTPSLSGRERTGSPGPAAQRIQAGEDANRFEPGDAEAQQALHKQKVPHSPLPAHTLPTPASAFLSVAPVRAHSVCVCVSLCFYVCSEGAIQSGQASWWEWWLLTPFSPTDRHL